MARIVMIGGGVVGLCGALLLGRDGHDVTVLERDPLPPPDPREAWAGWERRGVNQFRMLHFFQPGFRQAMAATAPDVVGALEAAGALLVNSCRTAPPEITGGFADADARFDSYTARRPVAEAAIAQLAAATDGVTIRRGVTVRGLLTGTPGGGGAGGAVGADGVPHVVGVRTDGGDDVPADLVVDVGGRRSALPGLLAAVGARPPIEEKAECGFIYYGRHFRSSDGSTPPAFGSFLMLHHTVSLLTLPADNGTWGVGIVASAKDAALRGLKDLATWTRAVRSFPLAAHWLDGEPLDDEVAVMAKIEDRHRSFVVDDQPVATGVLALGDSWACTNPSVGRGISIGALHAVALRDVLHDAPSDPVQLARCWHGATLQSVEPWYRSTLAFDGERLAEVDANIAGRRFEPSVEYSTTMAVLSAAAKDPEVLRAALAIGGVLDLPSDALAAPGLLDKVDRLGGGWQDEEQFGPDRDALLALVNGPTA
ncbi:MAG: dependent oxidoreductase [Ilumatobacteraceae bacterium]|nr:dependent oxidoreductase [Ilumatobacteraceae bacterium]